MQTASHRPTAAHCQHVHAPALSTAAQALLTAPERPGSPEPYTLGRHITNYQQGITTVFVQVRDWAYKHTRCGVIRDTWTTPDGVDLWIVDLVDGGRMHARAERTTQCSRVDGRCTCAGER